MMQSVLALSFAVARVSASFLIGLLSFQSSLKAQIVDCVNPAKVSVSEVKGWIFDPTGVAVPEAAIVLSRQGNEVGRTKSEFDGKFKLKVPAGVYELKAVLKPFQAVITELDIRPDMRTFVHPNSLRIVLGLSGSFCPWVTTNDKEFQREIHSNNTRLEEASQRHATQK